MSRAEILLYHSHTPESNKVSEFLDSKDDFIIENHHADYAYLIEKLPDKIDPVIVRTEHGYKRAKEDEKSFHKDFQETIKNKGGQISEFQNHITGTLGDNKFSVIDGVEANYQNPEQHILFCGLDIDEEINAHNISMDEVLQYSEESAWAGIPHWNIMTPSNKMKEEYFRTADDIDDIEIALSHNGGYGSLSKWVNDEHSLGESEIKKYSDEFGLDILPELDTHVTFTQKLNHTGLLEEGTVSDLRDGYIPVDKILGAETVDEGFSPLDECRDNYNFGLTFVSPNLKLEQNDYIESLQGMIGKDYLPASEEDFRDIMERNIDNVCDDVSVKYLRDNSVQLYED